MKTVAMSIAARKAFRKLPADVQVKIMAKLARYAATGAGDVKAMVGQESRRLRVDDYRAIFNESEDAIMVTDVGHRREIYR